MAIDHAHVWIPGSTRRTLLLFHGTGGNESDLIPLAQGLDGTASILGVRGRSMDEGYPRFFRRLAEGRFDEEDLRQKTDELADFLISCAHRFEFDLSASVSIGFSNGANIVASMLLSRSEAVGDAILLRAMVPFRPLEAPNLVGKRILLASGEHDPLVPVANATELARMLREAGADVEHTMGAFGHNLTRSDVEIAQRWLAERP